MKLCFIAVLLPCGGILHILELELRTRVALTSRDASITCYGKRRGTTPRDTAIISQPPEKRNYMSLAFVFAFEVCFTFKRQTVKKLSQSVFNCKDNQKHLYYIWENFDTITWLQRLNKTAPASMELACNHVWLHFITTRGEREIPSFKRLLSCWKLKL